MTGVVFGLIQPQRAWAESQEHACLPACLPAGKANAQLSFQTNKVNEATLIRVLKTITYNVFSNKKMLGVFALNYYCFEALIPALLSLGQRFHLAGGEDRPWTR